MRSALSVLGLLLVLPALPSSQPSKVYTERFGTRYLTGRVGLKPFDSGLTIAEDRIIVTTSQEKNGLYVEAFSIPLHTITSAEVTHERPRDTASPVTTGGTRTNSFEYVTIVIESATGAEALVFQASRLEGAEIVAKINVAIKPLKARNDPVADISSTQLISTAPPTLKQQKEQDARISSAQSISSAPPTFSEQEARAIAAQAAVTAKGNRKAFDKTFRKLVQKRAPEYQNSGYAVLVPCCGVGLGVIVYSRLGYFQETAKVDDFALTTIHLTRK